MASLIRTAKIFQNGGSRAIRLPKEFELNGNEVVIKQEFGIITILPRRPAKGSLSALLEAIGPVELAPREQPGWTDARDDRVLHAKAVRSAKPKKRKNRLGAR